VVVVYTCIGMGALIFEGVIYRLDVCFQRPAFRRLRTPALGIIFSNYLPLHIFSFSLFRLSVTRNKLKADISVPAETSPNLNFSFMTILSFVSSSKFEQLETQS
jgi:hypothetical protein